MLIEWRSHLQIQRHAELKVGSNKLNGIKMESCAPGWRSWNFVFCFYPLDKYYTLLFALVIPPVCNTEFIIILKPPTKIWMLLINLLWTFLQVGPQELFFIEWQFNLPIAHFFTQLVEYLNAQLFQFCFWWHD